MLFLDYILTFFKPGSLSYVLPMLAHSARIWDSSFFSTFLLYNIVIMFLLS